MAVPGRFGARRAEPAPAEPACAGAVEGKTVLVNGAAGGVGHFAVQVAKLKGAHVIAVASGKREALLRNLGADAFIDYTKTPPEDVAHDIDVVIDALGGARTGRFLRTLKPGGTLLPVFPWASPVPKMRKSWASRSRQPRSGRAARSWQKLDDPELREITEQLEHVKASIRAAVEHPFRVLKRQFGFTKVRYKGLAKNGAQVTTLFALVNLWMARKRLMLST